MRLARRVGVLAVGLLVLAAAAACGPVPVSVVSPTADPSAAPNGSPSASPSPTAPPIDPEITREVCTLATAATNGATSIFNDRIAALEQAAAGNDQASMVAAAEAINRQFLQFSANLTQLAAYPISPELKTVLTDIITALNQMSSLSYTGTTVDIRKKLLDFAAAFTRVCGPASPSPSP
jgi:hypothetical protein